MERSKGRGEREDIEGEKKKGRRGKRDEEKGEEIEDDEGKG